MRQNLTVTIRARITPELDAAIQARATELHLKKSDLVRLALAAAVQGKGLTEVLDRFDQVRVNKPWRVEYKEKP